MSLTRTVFRSDAGLLRNTVLPREAILFCGVISFCKPVPALVFFHGLKISDTTSAARDNACKRRWIAGPPKRLGVHRAVHALQRVGHIDDARRRASFREGGGAHDAHAIRDHKMLGIRCRGEDEAEGGHRLAREKARIASAQPLAVPTAQTLEQTILLYRIAFVDRAHQVATRLEPRVGQSHVQRGWVVRAHARAQVHHFGTYGIERLGAHHFHGVRHH